MTVTEASAIIRKQLFLVLSYKVEIDFQRQCKAKYGNSVIHWCVTNDLQCFGFKQQFIIAYGSVGLVSLAEWILLQVALTVIIWMDVLL